MCGVIGKTHSKSAVLEVVFPSFQIFLARPRPRNLTIQILLKISQILRILLKIYQIFTFVALMTGFSLVLAFVATRYVYKQTHNLK